MLSLELVLLHGIEVCRVPLYRSMWYGHLRRMVGACVFRGHSSGKGFNVFPKVRCVYEDLHGVIETSGGNISPLN